MKLRFERYQDCGKCLYLASPVVVVKLIPSDTFFVIASIFVERDRKYFTKTVTETPQDGRTYIPVLQPFQ